MKKCVKLSISLQKVHLLECLNVNVIIKAWAIVNGTPRSNGNANTNAIVRTDTEKGNTDRNTNTDT